MAVFVGWWVPSWRGVLGTIVNETEGWVELYDYCSAPQVKRPAYHGDMKVEAGLA